MDVVVHEYVGMQRAAGFPQRVTEKLQIQKTIGVIEEARQAVIATLDDMLCRTGKVESRLSGHASRVAAFATRLKQALPRLVVGLRRAGL